ncbi:hypothetical protein ASG40_13335 [Methylobacterium sp. Leaf399]|uniref:hypothetical protein n=1 Tax=unclassified Methylobacterium TaxID=2615210 RepID=UPI0006F570BB|nr:MULTISPECIES: hypothetical protein [unclassified Methylobacterium]KQP50897.1 hypothetical protein ASF39_11710 [Methylobacterium sp. Leaf108]KQT07881.1 hypothetical protein ASG40_13335 [Methylobacterium sp. Leaf399]KQT88993.1 hypothetical protein ASG59_14100 [Methylobacterium sp. Leaf466]
MTAIRIAGGACGSGAGAYEDGLFTMPDGTSRGIETVASLDLPEPAAPPAHWSGDLLRGLQGALASAQALPKPVSVAASAVGFGLGAFEATPPTTLLRLAFEDGADAELAVRADLAALIARDVALVRAALERRTPPAPAVPAAAVDADADRATTAMFEYEKRNGRLRRVARKDPAET